MRAINFTSIILIDMGNPKKKTPAQFIGAVLSLFIIISLLLIISPFLLMAAAGSSLRLLMVFLIFLGALFSFITIYKRKASIGVGVVIIMLAVLSYLDNPNTSKPFAFNDVCNEIRKDPYCTESANSFECSAQSSRGEFKSSKTICYNNDGNDEYSFKNVSHESVGRKLKTKVPVLLVRNLPRNNCRNRSCGYIVDAKIRSIRNSCAGCLAPDRVSTKLRATYLPPNSEFEVNEYFRITHKYNSMSSDQEYFVLTDSFGEKIEIKNYDFEDFFEKGDADLNENDHDNILNHLNQIEQTGSVDLNTHKRESLSNFIQNFQLSNEIEFADDANSGKPIYKVIVKSKEAYMTLVYFSKDWGVSIH